jgi:hypothetical protein
MVVTESNEFLEQLIKSQREAVRYYKVFTLALTILGIIFMAIALTMSAWLDPDSGFISDTFKGLFTLGGAFISSLGAFPLKEFLSGVLDWNDHCRNLSRKT